MSGSLTTDGFIARAIDDGIATPTTLLVKQQSATAAGSVTANGTVGVQTGGVVQLEWNASGSLLLARWGEWLSFIHKLVIAWCKKRASNKR